MTMIEKYRNYLRYEKNYSSHTEISYYTDLIQFKAYLETHPSRTNLTDVDADVVRDWIVSLMNSKVTSSSVNRKLSSLKSFYRFLQKIGEITNSPLKKISGPKKRKQIPSFVNYPQMKTILDNEETLFHDFESIRDKVIVELFYMTGIRRAELIGLRNENVDLDACYIKVLGKRNKERIIPISSKTKKLLVDYLAIKKKEVEKQNEYFFVRLSGEALYPMLVYRIVHESLRWIPTLKKASPHVLRHSFATGMLNNSASINSVKELLGHESLASTEIYTHTSFEELKKIYSQAHPRA